MVIPFGHNLPTWMVNSEQLLLKFSKENSCTIPKEFIRDLEVAWVGQAG